MPMLTARQVQDRRVVVDFEAISFTIDHYLLRACSEEVFTPLSPYRAAKPPAIESSPATSSSVRPSHGEWSVSISITG